MASRMAIWVVGIMLFLSSMVVGESGGVGGGSSTRGKCKFPAIFNFGDSNSDTGAASAAFNHLALPYGMSFNKSKRASDGRLMLDFFVENLGLPYLDAAIDAIGTSFKQGANFAVGGSKISPIVVIGMITPLHLDAQVSEFLQFKSRTIALSHHQPTNNKNSPPFESNYPQPEVFSKALYTFDIGHNDLTGDFYNSSIPAVVDNYSNSLQRLLGEGAKYLWIHSAAPHGCLPQVIRDCKTYQREKCVLDENGCVKKNNDQAQELNKLLKETIYKLRAQYPDASITFVDLYTPKLSLILNAKQHGFNDPFSFCCGTEKYTCGSRNTTILSKDGGPLLGTACNDPSNYISWDAIHYTEAANRFVANLIINGSYSDPPLPLAQACHKA